MTKKDIINKVGAISALTAAMKKRNKYAVRRVLEADPEFSSRSFDEAIVWGDFEVLDQLHSVWPSFSFKAPAGATTEIIMDCLKKGDPKLLSYLVNSGIFSPASLGEWLRFAIYREDDFLVRQLLSLGAEPFDGESANAAANAEPSMLQILIDDVLINSPNVYSRFGAALIFRGVIGRGVSGLKSIEAFAKARLINFNGFIRPIYDFVSALPNDTTPFQWAIEAATWGSHDDFAVVRKLLELGADPNSLVRTDSTENKTALLEAIDVGWERLVELLIDAGGDVNRPAQLGVKRTPLQRAAELGSVSMVKLLLAKGADVNAEPAYSRGATALQCAAMSGNCAVAKILVDAGAHIRAAPASRNGRWPLEAAAEHGRTDMIEYLWSIDRGFPEQQYRRAMEFAQGQKRRGCRDLIEKLSYELSPTELDIMETYANSEFQV